MDSALVVLVLVVGVVALVAAALVFVLVSRRPDAGGASQELQRLRDAIDQLQSEQRRVASDLGLVQQGIVKLESGLGHTEQRGQELASSLQQLSQVLNDTRVLLSEMRRGDEEALRRQQQMADVLARLEGVIAGARSRGAAGERILEALVEHLPADFKVFNCSIKGRVVELAFRLPNGKYVPVDSKWVAVRELEELASCDDPAQLERLVERIERALERKIEDVAAYLDPDLTLGIGVVAVPEAVYQNTQRSHAYALRQGVVIISYSLAVPYLLTLLQLAIRFAPRSELDPAQLSSLFQALEKALADMEGELNGRVSRALTMLQNGQSDLQRYLGAARGALVRIQAVTVLEEPGQPPLLSSSPPALDEPTETD
jgi:DNA recombination protein RmuC